MEGYLYPLTVEGPWASVSTKTLTNKLQVYFQSRKKSQGGDCEVKISEQTSSATVSFRSAEVRDQVLTKGDHSITIDGQSLELKVFKPGDVKEEPEDTHRATGTVSDVSFLQTVPTEQKTLSVRVDNVPKAVNKEHLEMYFEKWGGPVETISTVSEEQAAVITFQSSEAVQRILGKNDHSLCKVPVSVKPYFGFNEIQNDPSSKQAPKECLGDLKPSGAVVVENVTDNFSQEMIMLIMENISSISEQEFFLEMIRESQVAIVNFYDPSAAEKFLVDSRSNKKFQQYGFKAQPLEKSRSVKVENVSGPSSKDLLELYFEKWGGTVESITMIPNEQAAIVTFHSPEAVEKIVGKEHHIGKNTVSVYPYFKSLGTALYGKDRPAWSLPKPFKEKIHPAISEFLKKKGLISSISKQMDSVFCKVNFGKNGVQLSPHPSLLRQKDITKMHIDNWKQNALRIFSDQLSNYDVFEHEVFPPMWSTIEKDIQAVVKDKTLLRIKNGILTLAGMAQDIKMLKPILENILKKASDQMNRHQSSVSESVDMSPAMFSLFLQEGLQHNAVAKYPNLVLAYKNDTKQLTICGLPMEVLDIKNWILERRVRMNQKPLKMDPSLLEFLRSVDCDEMSKDLFTSKGICAVFSIESGDVMLTGSTDTALTEAEKRFQTMLTSNSLSLEDAGVLEKTEWRSLNQELLETYNLSKKRTVTIKSSNHRDRLVVSGFKQPVSEVSRRLEKFINNHSRIEEVFRLKSYAVAKFICDKKSTVWEKLVKPNGVEVHFDTKRPFIHLSGERVHVQPAVISFQEIAGALLSDNLVINKAGAKKYFQEQATMFLLMIKDRNFVVLLEESHMLEDDEAGLDEDNIEEFGQLSCEVQMPGGVIITVRSADICQFKVDAVVNAANEDLKHIGGVALALLQAAGRSLQECSDRYVATNGQVPPGHAVTTEAGHLPCKYVVHAVGPRYTATDRLTAVERLRQAVRESLKEAINHNCSSIAIPAISSGIFGFPLELCTETIAKELHAYVEDQKYQGGMNTLKQIHLVDNNASTVNAMAQAVKKEFGDFNPRMIFPKQMKSHGPTYRGRGNRGQGYRGCGSHGQGFRGHGSRGQGYRGHSNRGHGYRGNGPRVNEPQFYKPNETADFEAQGETWGQTSNQLSKTQFETQYTQEGLRILFNIGNIQDALSDVIVNTISANVDLSSGAVSKAILQAAGPQLQSEASSHLAAFGSSLSYGDIMTTGGYNLNCQRVFHAVCPFWKGRAGSEDEALRRIISGCLQKAERQQMTSISFPAIGTGNLGFPKDLVSRIFLEEINYFSAKITCQYLKEVTVVVHPSDSGAVQCFTKSFRGGKPGSIPKGAQNVQQQQKSNTKISPRISPAARSSQSPGLFGVVSTSTLGVHSVQVGHVTLEVSSGDITKEKSVAIVNSSNSLFSLKTGVSKAILDAAGSAVEQECKQIVGSPEMIVTSGGQLPCRHIIHIIGRNNPDAIKDVVSSVLKLCEEQKFSSIAFPALGTGQGGASPSAVADAMIDAVTDFVKKNKGVHLQTVKFLIFQASMVSEFHQSMLRRQQGKLESAASYFKGDGLERSSEEDFEMKGEEFEPAVFQLCGESQQDLNEARDLVNSFIIKEHTSASVRDSTINSFTKDDADTLTRMQKELTVSIQLTKSSSDSVITVEGLTRDVVKVESTIRDMIRKVERREAREREALRVSSNVEWNFLDRSNNLKPFDMFTNYDLEEAFRQKQPRLKIKINNEQYEVDLANGMAVGRYGQIELKRVDVKDDSSEPLPSHWEDMKGSFFKQVKIQQGIPEYTDVENEFRRTGLQNNILSIKRIQNSTLWRSYMIQKKHMDNKNNHKNNEKKLFHGTSSDNIDKINDRGFNRSYAGMHGAMYGNGVYFAVDPSYSAQGYSKPDGNGHKRMYLARVLVGDFTNGKSGLLAPPAKGSAATDLYDSVTDNQQNPSMFVIFHDVQAYPEYLITFQ